MRRSATRFSIVLALALALGACGDSDDSYKASDISDQTVQGTHDGQPFTLGTVVVTESAFDAGELDVTLYGETVDPCDEFASTANGHIMFSIPKQVGEYPLKFDFGGGDNRTVTFYVPPGENNIATRGIIVVESIDGTEVTMGILAEFDSGFEINGTFTTAICE